MNALKNRFGTSNFHPAISAKFAGEMSLSTSSFIKLKIRLLDYFYIMSFWRHKLFFFNDSISSYKMSFVSLKSVISDIEFNDHLPSTISVFITSKARQNFVS